MPVINISSTNIHYSVAGEGYPLVFLHGMFYDSTLYQGLIDILARQFQVYSIDIPFFGKSGPMTEETHFSDSLPMLGEILKKLKIHGPILCAHSMGAIFAIDYAAKNKVDRLILLEPVGIRMDKPKPLVLLVLCVKSAGNILQDPLLGARALLCQTINLLRNIHRRQFWRFFSEGYDYDSSPILKKIKCKTIVLAAKMNDFHSPEYLQQFLQIKKAKLYYVDGNHDWPVCRPYLIRNYLNELK